MNNPDAEKVELNRAKDALERWKLTGNTPGLRVNFLRVVSK